MIGRPWAGRLQAAEKHPKHTWDGDYGGRLGVAARGPSFRCGSDARRQRSRAQAGVDPARIQVLKES